MTRKNMILTGLIEDVLYEINPQTTAEMVFLDDDTTMAAKIAEIDDDINIAKRSNLNAFVFFNKHPIVNSIRTEDSVYIELRLQATSHVFYGDAVYDIAEQTITFSENNPHLLYTVVFDLKTKLVDIQYFRNVVADGKVVIGHIFDNTFTYNDAGCNENTMFSRVNSGLNIAPWVWTSKSPVVKRVVDEDRQTFTISYEQLYIIDGRKMFTIAKNTFVTEHAVGDYLFKVLYDVATKNVRVISIDLMSNENEIVIFTFDRDQCVYIHGGATFLHPTKNLTLTPIILSRSEGFINFNSVEKTITFPDDTLLLCNRSQTSKFYQLSIAKNNNVISYAEQTSTALIVYYDIDNASLGVCDYSTDMRSLNCLILCVFRTTMGTVATTAPYKWNYRPYNLSINNNNSIKTVNHRGYSNVAPENTLSAFKLSKDKGFSYVECDVSFTSDGVAVLLHDSTVDRTSNGTGSITTLTFEDVRALDFGSWKSSSYAGEKIPSFEEFILLCKNLGLHPYIDLKSNDDYTEDQIQSLVRIVKQNGMKNNVTWISFNATYLEYVKRTDNKARLGYVVNTINSEVITKAKSLRTDYNNVFVDCNYANLNDENIQLCVDADLELEVWTVNSVDAILSLDPYVTGVTSNSLDACVILYDANR